MTFEEAKMIFVKAQGFDQEFAEDFFAKLNQAYQDNIDQGVEPGLSDWYGEWKVKQGKQPIPLVWSGELKEGLQLGEVSPEKVTIVNIAGVQLSWHASDYRAEGVPKRDPLPVYMVQQITDECVERMMQRKLDAYAA